MRWSVSASAGAAASSSAAAVNMSGRMRRKAVAGVARVGAKGGGEGSRGRCEPRPSASHGVRQDPGVRVAVVAEWYPSPGDPVHGVWAHRQALAARDAGAELRVLALRRPVPPLSVL